MNKIIKLVLLGVSIGVIIVGVPIFAVGCAEKDCITPSGTTGGYWNCTRESDTTCNCKQYDSSGNLIDVSTKAPEVNYKNGKTIAGGIIMNVGIVFTIGSVFLILGNPESESTF